jgi:hypothetical protein
MVLTPHGVCVIHGIDAREAVVQSVDDRFHVVAREDISDYDGEAWAVDGGGLRYIGDNTHLAVDLTTIDPGDLQVEATADGVNWGTTGLHGRIKRTGRDMSDAMDFVRGRSDLISVSSTSIVFETGEELPIRRWAGRPVVYTIEIRKPEGVWVPYAADVSVGNVVTDGTEFGMVVTIIGTVPVMVRRDGTLDVAFPKIVGGPEGLVACASEKERLSLILSGEAAVWNEHGRLIPVTLEDVVESGEMDWLIRVPQGPPDSKRLIEHLVYGREITCDGRPVTSVERIDGKCVIVVDGNPVSNPRTIRVQPTSEDLSFYSKGLDL